MSSDIEKFYSLNEKKDENGTSYYLSLSSLRKEESYALYNIVKKYKPTRALEVGLALAGSAIAVITAKKEIGITEKHIALDPFQKSNAGNVGLLALKNAGLGNDFIHHEEFSEHYFNKMFGEKALFDLIFIDGNHTIGQAVTDVFLADKILNKNGIIGIHDSLLFSTAASVKYLLQEKNYSIVSPVNNSFKRMARQVKYIRKLGFWYCFNVIPKINVSVIFLQKNEF